MIPLCYASYWPTELLSINLQADLCSTALLMPVKSTSIAFWRFPTVEFPLTNHKLQMTNLSTERSLRVLLDHLSDSQYLGAKVQSNYRSNWINALCHVAHSQPPSGALRNIFEQTSSNICMVGVYFHGCLCFQNRLNSS